MRGLDPVAFVNPDGRQVVAVATSAAVTLHLRGLEPGRYGIGYLVGKTGDTLPDADLAAGGVLDVAMPGPGLLVVSAR